MLINIVLQKAPKANIFKVEIDSPEHFKVPDKIMVPPKVIKERSQSAPVGKGVHVGKYMYLINTDVMCLRKKDNSSERI